MPKKTTTHTVSPGEPGTPEAIPSQNETTDAAVSKDAAGAESQAPIASDRLEDTAPAEPETAAPTSPQDDTSEAGTTKDEAGAESLIPAAPSNTPENNLLLTAEGHVKQPAELDDGGCFEPFIPQVSVSVSPAPKPAPKPKPSSLTILLDKMLRDMGVDPTPTVTTSETGLPAPAAAEGTGDAEMTSPSEILPAPVKPALPPPRVAKAVELIPWITLCFLTLTHLLEDAAEKIAFWVISTWFQDALTVFPCLVITGPAHDAMVVLRLLQRFCRAPLLVSDFRKGDLQTIRQSCHTVLISEPNLNKRSAALLGNLTNRGFRVVADGGAIDFSMSRAIYLGEKPATHKIQNSISIHIGGPTNEALPAPPQGLDEMIERIPVHLEQYRNRNLDHVRHWTWVPSGLSSESATIVTALGRGIVGAPELREKVVALLKAQDQQRLDEMSNTTQAIVVEATWAFIREGRKHAYAGEIAAKANRLREARGETARLGSENVGHELRDLGLHTHRMSAANGLRFDQATVVKMQKLAAMYMVEDTPPETENLHGSQDTGKK